MFRICSKCGVKKTLDCFAADNRNMTDGRRAHCKDCVRISERLRRNKFSDDMKSRIADRQRKYLSENLNAKAIHLFNSIKTRCKKNKRQISITKAYIYVVLSLGKCQVSGLPFRYPKRDDGLIRPFAPSIDRKDNSQDYTFENTQVVCSMYNAGKGHHDELDFIAMCMAVAENNKYNLAAIERLKELRSL